MHIVLRDSLKETATVRVGVTARVAESIATRARSTSPRSLDHLPADLLRRRDALEQRDRALRRKTRLKSCALRDLGECFLEPRDGWRTIRGTRSW